MVIDATRIGLFDLDLQTGSSRISQRCREILGLAPDEGGRVADLFALVHPADRPRLDLVVTSSRAPDASGQVVIEYRIIRPDQTLRWVRARARIVFGEPGVSGAHTLVRILGFLRDITAERSNNLHHEQLQSLTVALARAVRTRDVIEAAVTLGGRALGASGGAAAFLVEEGGTFEMVAGPGISPHIASEWQRYAREPQLPASRALASGQPCYSRTRAEYVAADPRFVAVAEALGIEAEATLPLFIGGRAAGVLSFIYPVPQRFDEEDDAYLRAVAEQCAQSLERARLFEAAQAAQEALAQANAEAQLAAERVQLALAAGAIVGTWESDLQRDRITVDERFAEYFGIDPALGRTGLSLETVIATVHPDDLAGLRQAIADAVVRGGPYSHEYRVRGLDAVYRWVQANGRVDLAADGTPLRFPGVLIDVQGRRALEAERDRATQLLLAFVDAVPGVVYAKDRDGKMLVANRGVSELLGKPPEEYLGKTDLEALEHKDQAVAIMATDRRIMDSGNAESLEEAVSYPDGRRAVWLSTKAPFRDGDGRVIGLIGSSIDITARKNAEQALLDADRRRNAFIAMLGHELRNPLAPIVTALKLMELKGGDAFLRERAVISRQATHLSRLVDDLLDVSRFLRGKVEIRRDPTDVVVVVRHALESVADLLAQSRHAVTVQLPERLVVYGDATRLTQLVVNLLTNAAKYTPSGGRIGVAVSSDATHVEIRVHDNGIGMSQKFLRTVFEPFTQAPQSFDRKSGGLGLGLAIVKTIAAAHQGTVTASSDGEGRGSEFVVRLVLAPVDAGELSEAQVEAAAPPVARRVLVVDDNVDAADSLAAALELSGHLTHVAYDGLEALAAAADFKPEVALLDLRSAPHGRLRAGETPPPPVPQRAHPGCRCERLRADVRPPAHARGRLRCALRQARGTRGAARRDQRRRRLITSGWRGIGHNEACGVDLDCWPLACVAC